MTSLLSWMGWFCISADSKMCCHGNINSPILLKFATKIKLSISNKITNFCSDWLRNDVTVTSLLFWRTQSFRSAPPRKRCHGNSKESTLKLLPFTKFLYIFRKSHQIWLNYLSPSLSYGQKASRVVPNTPPPPGKIGLRQPTFWCESAVRDYFHLLKSPDFRL